MVRAWTPRWPISIAVASLLLIWLNAYWCREAFLLEHFGQLQSIRGFWIALARLGTFEWSPQWWRYSYNGMPFEYAYPPGVPALIAATAAATGWAHVRAFGAVAAFVFCLGPLALFWFAADLTKRIGWSLAAALLYSLYSLSELVVPDDRVSWTAISGARRIMVVFAWDEVPHQLALALLFLAAAFLFRGLGGNRLAFWCAGILLALSMSVSVFGGIVGAMFLAVVWLAWPGDRLRNLAWLAGCGACAYLVSSPFLPPSLMHVIQRNANLAPAYGWTAKSTLALAAAAAGLAVLTFFARRWPMHLRLFSLFALLFTAIPFLGQFGLHFLPQASRYKIEMEAALALTITFAVAHWLERIPRRWLTVFALLLIVPGTLQVISHRRYAKKVLRPADPHQTIEYRVARWIESNAPGQRVMAPGSTGLWMNVFSAQEQFTGGSFPTTPTIIMQAPHYCVVVFLPAHTPRNAVELWLRAFGIDLLVVPGRESPEFWKPFAEPRQFEALLRLRWREDDTSIYEVPRAHRSLATAVPQELLVRHAPQWFFELHEIAAYAKALDQPSAGLEWRWIDANTAVIRGDIPRGRVVSTHVTYHPGWTAYAGGRRQPLMADGLDQLVIRPDCGGPCEIRLVYDGGAEARVTRAASGTTLGLALLGAARLLRRGRASKRALSR